MKPKPSKGRPKSDIIVKLPHEMSFEDAVRHVLKAPALPKKPRRKRPNNG
jgi:hypothetical protein